MIDILCQPNFTTEHVKNFRFFHVFTGKAATLYNKQAYELFKFFYFKKTSILTFLRFFLIQQLTHWFFFQGSFERTIFVFPSVRDGSFSSF